MLRAAVLALPLLGAPAAEAQQERSPFLTDPDALERRYGVGGSGEREVLPPAEGAATGAEIRPGTEPYTRPFRPGARQSGDVVDDRGGVVQPGARPFIRF